MCVLQDEAFKHKMLILRGTHTNITGDNMSIDNPRTIQTELRDDIDINKMTKSEIITLAQMQNRKKFIIGFPFVLIFFFSYKK